MWFHYLKVLNLRFIKRQFFKMFCLKVLISLGLILSFLLVSCSGDDSSSSDEDKENAGTEGTTGTTGTTGNTTNTENAGSQGSAEQDEAPKHWILSVPFQKIEAGSFKMGSLATERYRGSDEAQVQVTISKPFEIMTKEVTQSQWVKVMGSNPSRFKSEDDCDDHENDMCPNHPVERVSWDEVQEYIGKLNKALGLSGCDGTPSSSAGCYRLPTEAEWEYSARGGTTTAYSFGDDASDLGNYAWYSGNSDNQTHQVGLKEANPKGLYDVHGNVWEWVQDKYTSDLPGGSDPLNTSGSHRVIRGGSWVNFAHYLRSAYRIFVNPALRPYNVGFRLVRTL